MPRAAGGAWGKRVRNKEGARARVGGGARRRRKGIAYASLGCAYDSQGDHAKAIHYHTQCLAIAKEVGDRAGEGGAHANLGIAYVSQGGHAKDIKYLLVILLLLLLLL